MSELINRPALLEEIKNGKDKPEIYDGSQEVDWIMQCINKARAANEPMNLPPCTDTECTYNNGQCAIDGCGGYRNEG